MGSLLKEYKPEIGGYLGYEFWCVGCESLHLYYTLYGGETRWTFDNDFEKPTFSPSLLVYPSKIQKRCHLFVKKGMIEYCNDSDHDFAGKTVPMVEIPEGDKDDGV